ncbi:unnamed protein product [Arabidopsis halleri]
MDEERHIILSRKESMQKDVQDVEERLRRRRRKRAKPFTLLFKNLSVDSYPLELHLPKPLPQGLNGISATLR